MGTAVSDDERTDCRASENGGGGGGGCRMRD